MTNLSTKKLDETCIATDKCDGCAFFCLCSELHANRTLSIDMEFEVMQASAAYEGPLLLVGEYLYYSDIRQ